MKVKRIVANISTQDIAQAKRFYQEVLGLDLLMDHGWIQTFGSGTAMSVQVSVASEGGSGTRVPDLSIEVDDVDNAFERMNPGEYGVSTSAIRSASSSMSLHIPEPTTLTKDRGLQHRRTEKPQKL
jgi:hypothetical protein